MHKALNESSSVFIVSVELCYHWMAAIISPILFEIWLLEFHFGLMATSAQTESGYCFPSWNYCYFLNERADVYNYSDCPVRWHLSLHSDMNRGCLPPKSLISLWSHEKLNTKNKVLPLNRRLLLLACAWLKPKALFYRIGRAPPAGWTWVILQQNKDSSIHWHLQTYDSTFQQHGLLKDQMTCPLSDSPLPLFSSCVLNSGLAKDSPWSSYGVFTHAELQLTPQEEEIPALTSGIWVGIGGVRKHPWWPPAAPTFHRSLLLKLTTEKDIDKFHFKMFSRATAFDRTQCI